jgi:hypothetical protein
MRVKRIFILKRTALKERKGLYEGVSSICYDASFSTPVPTSGGGKKHP